MTPADHTGIEKHRAGYCSIFSTIVGKFALDFSMNVGFERHFTPMNLWH